ncbi:MULTISPECIES: DMT family transporter [unclassified Luteococcus]|uniref:DMT family transporter n=1 Tax=unclassified Luteococcus TaxID=2639923 RepID=UPI00313F0C24
MTQQLRASLALIGSMVLFAASYTITKVALVDVGPLTLGTVRFLLATVVIAGILAATRGWQRPTPRDARTLALGGLLGVTAYFALENLGVAWSTATDATLLSAAFPAVIAVTDVLLNKAVIGRRGWFGILLAMVGSVAIVFGGPISDEAGPKRLWGDLLILLAAVVWALYTFATREVVTRYSSWTTVLWQDGVGALAFIPLALTEARTWRPPSHPVPTISAVLSLTVLCSVLAMVLYALAVRQLSTAVVAASINLVPMFGLVIALLVLHEPVGWGQVAGCAVVIGGVWLTHRQ